MVYEIKPEEHGRMRVAEMGTDYCVFICMFAHRDMLTVAWEMPEPMRIRGFVDTRGQMRCLNLKADTKPVADGTGLIVPREFDYNIRVLNTETPKAKAWAVDCLIQAPTILVVTMG